jgi:hypothetical protein
VSTATTPFSLVGRERKKARQGADGEVDHLTLAIKEKYANPRHTSSQSTRKAMHQAHALNLRRSVTRCVVIRENGKGGSPVALARTEAAIFKGIGAREGLPDPFLQRQAKLYGFELKPDGGRAVRHEGDSACPPGVHRRSLRARGNPTTRILKGPRRREGQ